MKIQEEIIRNLDIDYSYRLAKRMEDFRSNPILGYRPAGSKAEYETGEMLRTEMERIGLRHVHKDAVKVDGWEFHHAVLAFHGKGGTEKKIQLGAYQTNLVTDGPEEFSLVYLGKGTEKDYKGKNVTGKLVLVDINQRDEWWINYPVYQAYLKGAKALIAVQCGGYGEIGDEALNAQDIAGPAEAAAFSVSRKDAEELKSLLEGKTELRVKLDADTCVKRDCTTYNICGCIPGKHPDRMVLLSAHYDSYFSGFQDDNTAVAMMLGIAKAMLSTGWKPNNTVLFCAMAAEEWGVEDSVFDWSSGAYEQIFTAHPEWVGKVIADLNFELPALAHGTRARIRSCYEYVSFLEEFLTDLPELTHAYPEETRVTAPIETWSDDFSMAIAGIPSMVNDFTGGSFMETHYHSQFDNDEYYDKQVYRLHHEIFALLVEALDRTAVVPLNFEPILRRAKEKLEPGSFAAREFGELLTLAEAQSVKDYGEISRYNRQYAKLLAEGKEEEAEILFASLRDLEQATLKKFKMEQDLFVKTDWYGNVQYPHEILQQNICLLEGTLRNLEEGNLSASLRKLYQVDNNAYAFMFSEEVYDHFTASMLHQSRDRLKWGYQRLMEHENLYNLVKTLLRKQREQETECTEEISYLKKVLEKQQKTLENTLTDLAVSVQKYFLKQPANKKSRLN